MFFSASSVKDTKQLYDFGIKDILVSYFYIRKSVKFYTEIINRIHGEGGLFMTDSGGFSFIGWGRNTSKDQEKESFWEPYIHEYLEFLEKNKTKIFSCANLDLDNQVGREVVDKWNSWIGELSNYTNIVYVAHKDHTGQYNDKLGTKRFEEYCKKYDYVGINHEMTENAQRFYAIAARYKKLVHGFGVTSIPLLKSFPFFSVDSTTWLGGVRYGTSYNYDGKNFRVNSYKKKYIRKGDKLLCKEFGINYADLLRDERNAVNQYNLIGWLGARREYLRSANVKLKNKPVIAYVKNAQFKEKNIESK
jgi:hypothetical protein